MTTSNKKRYIAWSIAIGIAIIFMLLSECFKENPKTTILVNAPETMIMAFEATFKDLELHKKYVIGQRTAYNGVEIPNVQNEIFEEDQQ